MQQAWQQANQARHEGIKPIIELVLELREKSGAPEPNPGPLHLPPDDVMQIVKDKVFDLLKHQEEAENSLPNRDLPGRGWRCQGPKPLLSIGEGGRWAC